MMTSCTNSKKEENTKTEASSESTVSHTDEDKLTFTFNGEDIKLPCKLGDITSLKPAGIEEKEPLRDGYYAIKLYLGDIPLASAVCFSPDENDNDMSDDEVTEIRFQLKIMEMEKEKGTDASYSYLGYHHLNKEIMLKELGEPSKEEKEYGEFRIGDGAVGFMYYENDDTSFEEEVDLLGFFSKNRLLLKGSKQ